MKLKEIQQLYWRAGFGLNPETIHHHSNRNRKQVVNQLFDNSKSYTSLSVDTSELEADFNQIEKYDRKVFMDFNKKSRVKVLEYNKAWIERLATTSEVLRERMHLFWTNHFVCRDQNIFHLQQYNDVMRKHALGNFGDFVKAISHQASMLKYLNNKQNVKRKPNENFGRELLELFTLGEGNYTEQDIKGASRAFTGWNHDFKGDFKFKKNQHDFGEKTFKGKTGDFDGNDIIDVILDQKQCARFVCSKVYKEFVNPTIDDDSVEELTEVFYKDYNIENLMRHLFMADWFYDSSNIGVKIKSPIELLVGLYRTVPYTFENNKSFLFFQRELGQVLTNPPNVAGWSGDKNWIDSNTMLVRLKFASMVLNNSVIALDEKGDLEESYEMYYKRMNNRKKYLKVAADWSVFDGSFKNVPSLDLQKYIIQSPLSKGAKKLITKLEVDDKYDFCVQLMSLPEYQMC